MKKKTKIIFFIGIIFSMLLVACNMKEAVMLNTEIGGANSNDLDSDSDRFDEETIMSKSEEQVGEETYIYVYICGEVHNPGVYQMKNTARVYEVLLEAGGYTIDADEEAMNLAQLVSDGLQICIPKKNLGGSLEETEVKDGRVNINKASELELQGIIGVGSVKAKAIVTYRTEHGNFMNIEDITKVEGIKAGTFEKIKEYIRVSE